MLEVNIFQFTAGRSSIPINRIIKGKARSKITAGKESKNEVAFSLTNLAFISEQHPLELFHDEVSAMVLTAKEIVRGIIPNPNKA